MILSYIFFSTVCVLPDYSRTFYFFQMSWPFPGDNMRMPPGLNLDDPEDTYFKRRYGDSNDLGLNNSSVMHSSTSSYKKTDNKHSSSRHVHGPYQSDSNRSSRRYERNRNDSLDSPSSSSSSSAPRAQHTSSSSYSSSSSSSAPRTQHASASSHHSSSSSSYSSEHAHDRKRSDRDVSKEFFGQNAIAEEMQNQNDQQALAHRIKQRQKQIDIGKNTRAYDNYVRNVPKYTNRCELSLE